MSGGSMGYLYRRVEEVLDNSDFNAGEPRISNGSDVTNSWLREQFRGHLRLIADALKEIELVDSGDTSPGDEDKAIRLVLAHGEAVYHMLRVREGDSRGTE